MIDVINILCEFIEFEKVILTMGMKGLMGRKKGRKGILQAYQNFSRHHLKYTCHFSPLHLALRHPTHPHTSSITVRIICLPSFESAVG